MRVVAMFFHLQLKQNSLPQQTVSVNNFFVTSDNIFCYIGWSENSNPG